MPIWVIIAVLIVAAVFVISSALTHLLWIVLGGFIGWFIKEGVDWLRLNVH